MSSKKADQPNASQYPRLHLDILIIIAQKLGASLLLRTLANLTSCNQQLYEYFIPFLFTTFIVNDQSASLLSSLQHHDGIETLTFPLDVTSNGDDPLFKRRGDQSPTYRCQHNLQFVKRVIVDSAPPPYLLQRLLRGSLSHGKPLFPGLEELTISSRAINNIRNLGPNTYPLTPLFDYLLSATIPGAFKRLSVMYPNHQYTEYVAGRDLEHIECRVYETIQQLIERLPNLSTLHLYNVLDERLPSPPPSLEHLSVKVFFVKSTFPPAGAIFSAIYNLYRRPVTVSHLSFNHRRSQITKLLGARSSQLSLEAGNRFYEFYNTSDGIRKASENNSNSLSTSLEIKMQEDIFQILHSLYGTQSGHGVGNEGVINKIKFHVDKDDNQERNLKEIEMI